ncbi:MAG: bifunctional UDP-N-acetylglucosamine diphosphorylase/glucosamine-1-phosphate N-acetyltransferase GlmU [Solirubrobacterales bacterium]|nr:bifunctional UDP-N-acetylglucosamine diphosphorylase/glucosamine-1-phosphate N-acetyltransferase GlmU [Solirubrobacterales bacterium]
MAAGEGTRMRSATPKVLHPLCGRAMIAWPVLAARGAGVERIAVIVSPDRELGDAVPGDFETVVQPQPDGTGGAVRAAIELVRDSSEVLVLSGDVPLVSTEVITELLETHRGTGAKATVMTAILDDPGTYGRVVRSSDGGVEKIVEAKAAGDATEAELEIREINSGTYVFDGDALAGALGEIDSDNAQGEYYLPDVLAVLRGRREKVAAHVADDVAVNLGVNTRVDLAAVEAEARRRILERHMLAGVTVVDPGSTWIDADVTIGPDARIEPGTSLRGATEVGAGAVIGPHSTVTDCGIGAGSQVVHSFLVLCEVMDNCQVGPFAYLRPGAELADGSKAGAFVEIKNSTIAPGAKVPHLSYVGDAEIGEGANLGAGTITANYDGRRKHRTVVGPGARLGVDTMLVAPVEIGEGAYTGAGAIIRDNVPAGSLAVSRGDQRTIEEYAQRRQAREEEQDQDS